MGRVTALLGNDDTSCHTGNKLPQPCWGETLTAMLGITTSQTRLLGNNILMTNSAGETLLGKTSTSHSAGILNWGNLPTQACWGYAILTSAEERRYHPQTPLQGNTALTDIKLARRRTCWGTCSQMTTCNTAKHNAPGVHGQETLKCPQHSK